MEDSNKDLLELEQKKFSSSSIESKLFVCGNDNLRGSQQPKLKPCDGMPVISPVPKSQVLGKVKGFLGVISEANKRLQDDAKDNAKDYDIEVLNENASEYIEMDLMLGVTDLLTPEAVAAAESAMAGSHPVISFEASCSGTESESESESGDSSDVSTSDNGDNNDYEDNNGNAKCCPTKTKRCEPPEGTISGGPSGKSKSKKRPKIVELL